MLEMLVFQHLPTLERMAGLSNNGVWNEQILPKLCLCLEYISLPIETFPTALEKLLYLSTLFGEINSWETIICEKNNMKPCLQKLFRELEN